MTQKANKKATSNAKSNQPAKVEPKKEPKVATMIDATDFASMTEALNTPEGQEYVKEQQKLAFIKKLEADGKSFKQDINAMTNLQVGRVVDEFNRLNVWTALEQLRAQDQANANANAPEPTHEAPANVN